MYKKTKLSCMKPVVTKNLYWKDQKATRHMDYFFNSKGKYGILLY